MENDRHEVEADQMQRAHPPHVESRTITEGLAKRTHRTPIFSSPSLFLNVPFSFFVFDMNSALCLHAVTLDETGVSCLFPAPTSSLLIGLLVFFLGHGFGIAQLRGNPTWNVGSRHSPDVAFNIVCLMVKSHSEKYVFSRFPDSKSSAQILGIHQCDC